jgi:hypothetical protein
VHAQTTTRKTIRPPSGFEDYLGRREVAALLGFASEFKVRQLEKEGRLRPVRGAMGSAWYPRSQVEALRDKASRPLSPTAPRVRWPDDALIALLREKPRTIVDLVVDAGISISRAERVYRFWLAHEGPREVAHEAPGVARDEPGAEVGASDPRERRSEARMERDALVRQLRDADPKVRAAAFEKLKRR